MLDSNKQIIVVMDMCNIDMIDGYNLDRSTNEFFSRMLNAKLNHLKKSGSKIVETNYRDGFTNEHIDVEYDLKTTSREEFLKFVKLHKPKRIIYTGSHYGRCIHASRSISAINIKEILEPEGIEVYVCPFLCRPYVDDFGKNTKNDVRQVDEIYL
jgi:hypothetical protein